VPWRPSDYDCDAGIKGHNVHLSSKFTQTYYIMMKVVFAHFTAYFLDHNFRNNPPQDRQGMRLTVFHRCYGLRKCSTIELYPLNPYHKLYYHTLSHTPSPIHTADAMNIASARDGHRVGSVNTPIGSHDPVYSFLC